jgi:hypothetical protein
MSSSGKLVYLLLEEIKKRRLNLLMKAIIQKLNHSQLEEIPSILTLIDQMMTLKIQMMICQTLMKKKIRIKRRKSC